VLAKKKELAEIGEIADRAGLFTDASELAVVIPEQIDVQAEAEAETDGPVFEVTMGGDSAPSSAKKVKLGDH
jgi:hypothetical protein